MKLERLRYHEILPLLLSERQSFPLCVLPMTTHTATPSLLLQDHLQQPHLMHRHVSIVYKLCHKLQR